MKWYGDHLSGACHGRNIVHLCTCFPPRTISMLKCSGTFTRRYTFDIFIFQYGPRQAKLVLIAHASSEGSGSAQTRQNLRCSLIQAVSQEEPSDRKSDSWPLWMAGHAQLKFVMTECSKTQIRLTGLIYNQGFESHTITVASLLTANSC